MKPSFQQQVMQIIDHPKRSIQTKLVLFFLIVTLIPLILLGVLSYHKSSNVVNSQLGSYGEFAVRQLQYQIDSNLTHMHLIASDIQKYLSDPTLIVLNSEQPKTYEGFIEQRNFERFLEGHKTTQTKGIFLITQSGYYFGKGRLDIDELTDELYWKEFMKNSNDGFWTGLYTPDHYNYRFRDGSGEKVIGLLVPTKSSYGILKDSRILIETNAEELFQLIHTLEKDLNSIITITDKSTEVIYQTDIDLEKSSSDIVWEKNLSSSDWTVEVRIPHEQFYQSSSAIQMYTIIGIAISLLLALLLAFLFSKPITGRIKRLMESMHQVSNGDLQTRTFVDSNDELGKLERSFNTMVGQIQSLVREVSQKERLKKDAELKAFHYQINPHLLFNTLNSIQWKARLLGVKEIQEMIYHLTEVLEGNLDFTNELIPLEKELNIIEHFLKVQEIRYGKSFDYNLNCDSDCEKFLIPRMSLQPLFENIFFHGFEDGCGAIELSISCEDDLLHLILKDDGKGIKTSKLPILLDELQPKKGKGGIGLYNIHQKFKLHFGHMYGLSLDSERGRGTTIHICWPKEGYL
ncbi:sensor histidine kinase [Pseudalkalibacillus decolorationis]|uniref:sensor histidine kinase n=1 Tax=Pseudalkalibacillus decolorationis TaxID=163879 RepID=UPI002147658D|nr:sensor histidine kinase [Pseudalkalibacillus decolorationis]